MTDLDPSRILISCQGSGREPFPKEAIILFKSLNIFGGRLSKAQKIAYFTEPVDTSVLHELESLGVKVRIIEAFHDRFVYLNKIQILRSAQEEDCDLVITLDTDVVITNDFFPLIDETKIGGAQEDLDQFGIKKWEKVFQYFNVPFPSNREIVPITGEQTIPYFNGGFFLIPKIHLLKLLESWQFFINKLINTTEFPEISSTGNYMDQVAMILALNHTGLPYYNLPPCMISTHIGSHKDDKNVEPFQIKYRQSVSTMRPYIIHHHHKLTKSGFVRYCYYDNINRVIDSLNLSLKSMSKDSMSHASAKTEWLQNTELDDPEMLVDGLYLEILQRPADKAGLEHFASLLENKKMHINDIRKELLDSDEYKFLKVSDKMRVIHKNVRGVPKGTDPRNEARTIVDELYMDILQRPADKTGLEHFASLLENKKMTIQEIRKALLDSDEYKNLKNSGGI